MGKAEVGSAKYVSNQLKAKGLSKLKFYCQVCAKQCRDDNGFKCHIVSKSHNDNIAKLSHVSINEYSANFQKQFLTLLKLNHGNKFIEANRFYQEYIQDKDHIHLNATKWSSLTLFCLHCQENGLLQIKTDPLQIRYIDKYKESLLALPKNQPKDTTALYQEAQIANNKKFQEPETEIRQLKDADTKTLITINLKDKKDKEINKCGVMCKPVEEGDVKPFVAFNKVKNPKLKPRKGNVFKMT